MGINRQPAHPVRPAGKGFPECWEPVSQYSRVCALLRPIRGLDCDVSKVLPASGHEEWEWKLAELQACGRRQPVGTSLQWPLQTAPVPCMCLTLSHLSSQKLASENLQGATLMKSPCVFNLPTRAKQDTWCSLLIMSPHIYRCSDMIP